MRALNARGGKESRVCWLRCYGEHAMPLISWRSTSALADRLYNDPHLRFRSERRQGKFGCWLLISLNKLCDTFDCTSGSELNNQFPKFSIFLRYTFIPRQKWAGKVGCWLRFLNKLCHENVGLTSSSKKKVTNSQSPICTFAANEEQAGKGQSGASLN